MSVILEGEDRTTTTLMRVEVTTTGIYFEIFHEKGRVRIILSEEKWIQLENHISARSEELHELKEKAKKGRQ